MADAPGDDVAVLLLRVLPAEVAELILGGWTWPRPGDCVRACAPCPPKGHRAPRLMPCWPTSSTYSASSSASAAGRCLQSGCRGQPETRTADEPAGRGSQPAAGSPRQGSGGEQPQHRRPRSSALDPAAAGLVMKRMPLEVRAEVALRMSKPGARNASLLQALAAVLAERVVASPTCRPNPRRTNSSTTSPT